MCGIERAAQRLELRVFWPQLCDSSEIPQSVVFGVGEEVSMGQ